MPTRLKTPSLLVLIGLVLTAGAAVAQPGRGPRMGMRPPGGPGLIPLPLILGDRSLTDEQRAQIDSILEEQHETVGTLFAQLDEAHDELTAALFADGTVTYEDLEPKAQRIADLRAQLLQQELRAAIAIRDVLTPEQLAAAADRKARLDSLRPEIMQFYVPE